MFDKAPAISKQSADQLRRECKEHVQVVEDGFAIHSVIDANGVIHVIEVMTLLRPQNLSRRLNMISIRDRRRFVARLEEMTDGEVCEQLEQLSTDDLCAINEHASRRVRDFIQREIRRTDD